MASGQTNNWNPLTYQRVSIYYELVASTLDFLLPAMRETAEVSETHERCNTP
jgi:hypothetical protein